MVSRLQNNWFPTQTEAIFGSFGSSCNLSSTANVQWGGMRDEPKDCLRRRLVKHMTTSKISQDDTIIRSIAWTPFHFFHVSCFFITSLFLQWDEREQLKMCFSPALKNNHAISGSLLRILYGSQQRKDFLRIWARLTAGPSSELYMVYSGRLLWRLRSTKQMTTCFLVLVSIVFLYTYLVPHLISICT